MNRAFCRHRMLGLVRLPSRMPKNLARAIRLGCTNSPASILETMHSVNTECLKTWVCPSKLKNFCSFHPDLAFSLLLRAASNSFASTPELSILCPQNTENGMSPNGFVCEYAARLRVLFHIFTLLARFFQTNSAASIRTRVCQRLYTRKRHQHQHQHWHHLTQCHTLTCTSWFHSVFSVKPQQNVIYLSRFRFLYLVFTIWS